MRKKRDGNLRPKIINVIRRSPGCTLIEIRQALPKTHQASIHLAVMDMERAGILKRVEGKSVIRRRWFLADQERNQTETQYISDHDLQKHLDEHIFSPTSEEDLLAHLMDAVSKIVEFKVKKEKDRYYDEIEELKLKIAKLEREKDPYLQKIFG